MFSKLLTRGFSFQFYFLLWEFNIAFSHFWEFFCSRHVNQDVVLKNCLYCSLEKYYFQSLLNGVFINKKRQPSNFRMLDKTEKEPVYYYWKVVYGRNVFCCTCELSNLWSATCDPRPVTILGDPGAVSRVGRKGRTKVFKYGRKTPWVPTLTELFPKIQADAGSWLGTKKALYYCAQSRTVPPEFFSWVRTRRILSRSRLVWLMHQRNSRSQETFSLI